MDAKHKYDINTQFPIITKELKNKLKTWKKILIDHNKILSEAKKSIEERDIQIEVLNKKLIYIVESTKVDIENKYRKEIANLQSEIKAKQKELKNSKEQYKINVIKIEEDIRKLKVERIEFTKTIQELKGKNSSLSSQCKNLQLIIESKTEHNETNNYLNSESLKLKLEIESLKKEIARLELEKGDSPLDISIKNEPVDPNERIRLFQRIRDENNALRAENYQLKENLKAIKGKVQKIDPIINEDQKIMYPYSNKYKERLEKEMKVFDLFKNVPELAKLFIDRSNALDPLEEIRIIVEHLIDALKV